MPEYINSFHSIETKNPGSFKFRKKASPHVTRSNWNIQFHAYFRKKLHITPLGQIEISNFMRLAEVTVRFSRTHCHIYRYIKFPYDDILEWPPRQNSNLLARNIYIAMFTVVNTTRYRAIIGNCTIIEAVVDCYAIFFRLSNCCFDCWASINNTRVFCTKWIYYHDVHTKFI